MVILKKLQSKKNKHTEKFYFCFWPQDQPSEVCNCKLLQLHPVYILNYIFLKQIYYQSFDFRALRMYEF